MGQEAIVYVVDDDVEVRRSLRWLLESVGMTVETFANAPEFLDAFDSARPSCLVLDMRMPEMSGLELQRELGVRGITIPIIIITAYGEVRDAVEAMKCGAVDFIEKPFSDQALLDQIHKALDRDIEDRHRHEFLDEVCAKIDELTPREREVMDLVVSGLSTKRIAEDLGISPKTVEAHRARIMQKMHAGSLADLVRLVVSARCGAAVA